MRIWVNPREKKGPGIASMVYDPAAQKKRAQASAKQVRQMRMEREAKKKEVQGESWAQKKLRNA